MIGNRADVDNGPGCGITLKSRLVTSNTGTKFSDGPHFVSARETRNGDSTWTFNDSAKVTINGITVTTASDPLDLGPVVKGRWIDFVLHIKWSKDPTRWPALREYYRDGVLVAKSTLQNLGNEWDVTKAIRSRMGIYQGPSVDHHRTLYWLPERVGNSYADVDPSVAGDATSSKPPAPSVSPADGTYAGSTQVAMSATGDAQIKYVVAPPLPVETVPSAASHKTAFETNDGTAFTTLSEEKTFLDALDAASNRISVVEVGKTIQGRPLRLVTIGAPAPKSKLDIRNGTSILFVGSQHGDEKAGREGALQLIRNLATTTDPTLVEMLTRQNVLVMPTMNPDGFVANTRGDSNGVDINRTHDDLSTIEAQVIKKAHDEHKPDIVVDMHEYGTALYPDDDDIKFQGPYDTNWPVSDSVRSLAKELGDKWVQPALTAAGFRSSYYDPSTSGTPNEGTLRSQSGLRGSPGLLIETPDAQPTVTKLQRVQAQVVCSNAAIEMLRKRAAALASGTGSTAPPDTDPETAGKLYAGAFTVSQSALVKAVAFNSAGVSPITFRKYAIAAVPSGSLLRGINDAGGEFGSPAPQDATSTFSNANPGVYDQHYHYSKAGTISFLSGRGIKTIRLPFRLERLFAPDGTMIVAERDRIKRYLDDAQLAGAKVVLDAHNYGGYYLFDGTQGVRRPVGSAEFTRATFAAMCKAIYSTWDAHPAFLGLGLMNEPIDLPESMNRTGSELVTDGGIEAGTSGFFAAANTTLARSTSRVHAGTGAAKLTAVAAGTVGMESTKFAVPLGAKIVAEAYASHDGTARTVGIQINWFTAGGTYISTSNGRFAADTASFSGYRIEAVAPTVAGGATADAGQATVKLVAQDCAAGEVHRFDSISAGVGTLITGAKSWEKASQVACDAIRTVSTKLIFVGGFSFSTAKNVFTHHPTKWIVGHSGIVYEFHYYPDRDNSGRFLNSYADEVLNAEARGFVGDATGDALRVRIRSELRNGVVKWKADQPGVTVLIGEIGWPSENHVTAANADKWALVGDDAYGIFDEADFHVTQWTTGEWWNGDNENLAYKSSTGKTGTVDTPLRAAGVVEAHLTKTGPLAPTVSPASGTYSAAQSVTASQSEGQPIYYTIASDGTTPTDPTSTSQLYTGAITVSKTSTLKFRSINGAGSSPVVQVAYTIGSSLPEPPTIAVASVGDGQVTLSLGPIPNPRDANDGKQVYRRINGKTEKRIDVSAATTTVTDTGLTNGQQYEYRASSGNPAALPLGPWSDPVYATPKTSTVAARGTHARTFGGSTDRCVITLPAARPTTEPITFVALVRKTVDKLEATPVALSEPVNKDVGRRMLLQGTGGTSPPSGWAATYWGDAGGAGVANSVKPLSLTDFTLIFSSRDIDAVDPSVGNTLVDTYDFATDTWTESTTTRKWTRDTDPFDQLVFGGRSATSTGELFAGQIAVGGLTGRIVSRAERKSVIKGATGKTIVDFDALKAAGFTEANKATLVDFTHSDGVPRVIVGQGTVASHTSTAYSAAGTIPWPGADTPPPPDTQPPDTFITSGPADGSVLLFNNGGDGVEDGGSTGARSTTFGYAASESGSTFEVRAAPAAPLPLVNPSFETGDATDWGFFFGTGATLTAKIVEGDGVGDEGKVLELSGTPSSVFPFADLYGGGLALRNPGFAVEPDQRIVASIAIKVTQGGGLPSLKVSYFNAAKSKIGEAVLATEPQSLNTWQVLNGTATVPANAAFARIFIGPDSVPLNTPTTFRVDAASVGIIAAAGWRPKQFSTTHELDALTEGEWVFEVRATDAAGNVDPVPAMRSFVVRIDEPPEKPDKPDDPSEKPDDTPEEPDALGTVFFEPLQASIKDGLPSWWAANDPASEMAKFIAVAAELADDLSTEIEGIHVDQSIASARQPALQSEWAALYDASNEQLPDTAAALREYLLARAAEDGSLNGLEDTLLALLRIPANDVGHELRFGTDLEPLTFPAVGAAQLRLFQDTTERTNLAFPITGLPLPLPQTFPQRGRLEITERAADHRYEVSVRDFLVFDRPAFARAVHRFRLAHLLPPTITETPT